MIIKICGITDINEIDIINKYEPDYIGFVFANSKRRVSCEKALMLNKKLKKGIKKCGIFVDSDVLNVTDIAKTINLDVIQLHGREDSDYIRALKVKLGETKIWKAIKVYEYQKYKNMKYIDRILIDAKKPGSGKVFEWEKIKEYHIPIEEVIIAGGLNNENIKKLLNNYKPFGVDISSGVEKNGKKNKELINNFITKIRS